MIIVSLVESKMSSFEYKPVVGLICLAAALYFNGLARASATETGVALPNSRIRLTFNAASNSVKIESPNGNNGEMSCSKVSSALQEFQQAAAIMMLMKQENDSMAAHGTPNTNAADQVTDEDIRMLQEEGLMLQTIKSLCEIRPQ
jgi:hypothetical protein